MNLDHKIEALKCHACSRQKNSTCSDNLDVGDFEEDCGGYTTHCAMLSVDNIIEMRGCMSTFDCRKRGNVNCCLCNKEYCNGRRSCYSKSSKNLNLFIPEYITFILVCLVS